jgi:hypothetical protein
VGTDHQREIGIGDFAVTFAEIFRSLRADPKTDGKAVLLELGHLREGRVNEGEDDRAKNSCGHGSCINVIGRKVKIVIKTKSLTFCEAGAMLPAYGESALGNFERREHRAEELESHSQ